MSSDQKKSNRNPVITRLSVIIPIVVSILSLLFGAYQYLDKSELEKRLLQYEIREKERNQADISVAYIETDLQSLYETGASADLTGWLSYLEKVLPFNVRLRIQETAPYTEVKDFRGSTQNVHITFLLIRNAGRSEATNIDLNFNAEGKTEVVRIDRLDPDSGVMFLIDHFDVETGESFGTAIRPGPKLTYFDGFLKENKTAAVRGKNSTVTIISPTVRMAI